MSLLCLVCFQYLARVQLILSFEEVAGATDEESAFVLKRITSRFLSRMQDRNGSWGFSSVLVVERP